MLVIFAVFLIYFSAFFCKTKFDVVIQVQFNRFGLQRREYFQPCGGANAGAGLGQRCVSLHRLLGGDNQDGAVDGT